jgi:hypothetical protein
MKIFGVNSQLRNKLFLVVFHRFSLVKATMNAPRNEYLLQPSKLLYNCQFKNKEALKKFKGLKY